MPVQERRFDINENSAAIGSADLVRSWAISSAGGGEAGFAPVASAASPEGTIVGTNRSDIMTATAGDDVVFGMDGSDTIEGLAGNDQMYGNLGSDVLFAGDGNDFVFGGQDGDTLLGDAGDDELYGQIGRDSLVGGDGADRLFGGQGSDTISGGNGDDWLTGNRDDDVLYGGAGADLFVFRMTMGTDTIADFNVAEGDRIELAASQRYVVTENAAGTAVVRFGNGEELVLSGHRASAVTDGWITLV